tara:strand:+ start:348 stop:1553 length:1206 start_codon:yes stop_codon:yes gene_type:complete
MNINSKISYAKTVYGKKEIDAVVKCLHESTQMGKYSSKFEKKISKLFDKKYGLYVNSGSSALYLAMEACNFPKNSEVITPVLTFSTTVGCIVKNNLIPVFVDVGNYDYCIDVNQIESKINKKTVAILAPNLLGNICDWIRISKIAKKHNLLVIEDSADTLGAKIKGVPTGAYSDISITSFYGSHIINCAGNGGALLVNDKKIMEKSKLLRSWGRSSSLYDENSEKIENRFNIRLDGIDYDSKFVFQDIGYNLEGNEVGAAFGLEQLKSLKNNIKIRRNNFNKQVSFFENYKDFFINPVETPDVLTGWLAFPILIKKHSPFKRKDFQIFLEKNNIQTRVIFTGNILKQPMSKNIRKKVSKAGYPNADYVMESGVLLPLHHGMTKDMFSRLHSVIESFVMKYI